MNDKIFIVCIELNSIASKNKLEQLLSEISSSKIKILEGVYAIRVSKMENSSQIRDRIIKSIGDQFEIFITKSSIDASWRLSGSVSGWLNAYI